MTYLALYLYLCGGVVAVMADNAARKIQRVDNSAWFAAAFFLFWPLIAPIVLATAIAQAASEIRKEAKR